MEKICIFQPSSPRTATNYNKSQIYIRVYSSVTMPKKKEEANPLDPFTKLDKVAVIQEVGIAWEAFVIITHHFLPLDPNLQRYAGESREVPTSAVQAPLHATEWRDDWEDGGDRHVLCDHEALAGEGCHSATACLSGDQGAQPPLRRRDHRDQQVGH